MHDDEVIARLRDLALVADKQPDAGEDALLLLLVDGLVDEDLTADAALFQFDQVLYCTVRRVQAIAVLLLTTALPWRTSPVPNQSQLRRLRGWRPAAARRAVVDVAEVYPVSNGYG